MPNYYTTSTQFPANSYYRTWQVIFFFFLTIL